MYTIEQIEEFTYGFAQHSEAAEMVRQLLQQCRNKDAQIDELRKMQKIFIDALSGSIGEIDDAADSVLTKAGWYRRGNGTWSHEKDGHLHRSKQDALNLTTMTPNFPVFG